jgi:hypothetical protein
VLIDALILLARSRRRKVPKILPENIGGYRWADTDQGGAVPNLKSRNAVL